MDAERMMKMIRGGMGGGKDYAHKGGMPRGEMAYEEEGGSDVMETVKALASDADFVAKLKSLIDAFTSIAEPGMEYDDSAERKSYDMGMDS